MTLVNRIDLAFSEIYINAEHFGIVGALLIGSDLRSWDDFEDHTDEWAGQFVEEE